MLKNYSNMSAILLASGNSSRFKKSIPSNLLIESKLDILIDDITLFEKTLITINSINFNEIIVVVNSDKYDNIIKKYNAKKILNKSIYLGISNSIKLSLENAKKDNDFIFFNCDIPNLTTTHLSILLEEYENNLNYIIRPKFKNNFYNPVIFPNSFKFLLENLKGDKGGCSICTTENTKLIENQIFENLIDIDTYNDYITYNNIAKHMKF